MLLLQLLINGIQVGALYALTAAGFSLMFGRGFVTVSTPLSRSIEIASGLYVSPLSGIAIVCAVLFFLGLQLFLTRTHVGIALRALAENPELVRAYGMSPRRLSTYAFA